MVEDTDFVKRSECVAHSRQMMDSYRRLEESLTRVDKGVIHLRKKFFEDNGEDGIQTSLRLLKAAEQKRVAKDTWVLRIAGALITALILSMVSWSWSSREMMNKNENAVQAVVTQNKATVEENKETLRKNEQNIEAILKAINKP